ncbi:MAG: TonB-dependent receptor plug domain-containing protein, partial [Caulobacter sp.]
MSRRFRRRLLGLSALVLVAAADPILAHAAPPGPRPDQAMELSLPAGPLRASLFALAQQSGVQIVFTTPMVERYSAPAVRGRLTARQALERLLSGTDLEIRARSSRVIALGPRLVPASARRAPLGGAEGGAGLEGDAASPQAEAAPLLAATAPPIDEAPTQLSEIVVGTHIRGVKDGASPVVVLDREALDRAGRATLAQALAALPQNFGGEATEATATTGADSSGTNSSLASGINLRGLGTDATLVLVNGRRMAGTGLKGDINDVSAIPMAAVERVEILLDGASALYGSDAVGGVVNIVLKSRYDGAETRLLTGGATGGGATQWQFGQTIGRSWDSGRVVASFEHASRDRVQAGDRSYAGNADLRPWGGSDQRWIYASPGNILRPDATGALSPAYAIPSGQNGTALTPASFLAGQVNLENQQAGYDILPRQRRDGLYLSLAQDLTPAIELSVEARAGRR